MKSRIFALVVIALLLLPLTVAALPESRYQFGAPPEIVQAEPKLVAAWWTQPASGNGAPNTPKYKPYAFINGMTYSDPTHGTQVINNPNGIALGCDFWISPNTGILRQQNKDDLMKIRFNRSTKVYVVWRGTTATKPTWINASYTSVGTVSGQWQPGASFSNWPVYAKVVPAGDSLFGSSFSSGTTPSGTRDLPVFAFCESDGTPTPLPLVPAGQEIPTPSTTCPNWVHDLHKEVGPDGQLYASWHPQIDPYYWCYYRHEHGTDPDYFDPALPVTFAYVSTVHGMVENHIGFKVYVFDTGDGLYRLRIVHHFGTSGAGRACAFLHTVEVAVKVIATGETVANLRFMADYGIAVNTDTQSRLTPTNCPAQQRPYPAPGIKRQIPVTAAGTGYEPWKFHGPGADELGITGQFTINTQDLIAHCVDQNCNAVEVRGSNSGSLRFLTNDGFGISDPGNGGSFCTDPLGKDVLTCTDPMAIGQYVKPGFSAIFQIVGGAQSGHCIDRDAWGLPYVCGLTPTNPTERENSIPTGGPN